MLVLVTSPLIAIFLGAAMTRRAKVAKPQLSRRSALAAVGAMTATSALAKLGAAESPVGGADVGADPGLIVREFAPRNLESDFAESNSFLTPNEKFYVRNHFPVPSIDVGGWLLELSGDGVTGQAWTHEQLRAMPAETKPVTLECAGNGRVLLAPKVDGAQWQYGAVGTAEWKGVPLAALLEKSGVPDGTVDVVLIGIDRGEPGKPSRPAGPIHYARSVPVERALSGGILLAYEMNGKPLSPAHGYPLRAIVPGWYDRGLRALGGSWRSAESRAAERDAGEVADRAAGARRARRRG
jgi:DMSO/TMAO reductase YedYZ molybdopterin-dependent catalytic subunit